MNDNAHHPNHRNRRLLRSMVAKTNRARAEKSACQNHGNGQRLPSHKLRQYHLSWTNIHGFRATTGQRTTFLATYVAEQAVGLNAIEAHMKF